MIRVCSINHVSLLVSDVSRALDFYRGVLGLELDVSRPDLGFPGAFLHAGNAQIHLLELPSAGQPVVPPGHGGRDRHVALDIIDLDAAQAVLTAAGIGYTLSRSGRRALFCRDPDGNAVELVEQLPAQSA